MRIKGARGRTVGVQGILSAGSVKDIDQETENYKIRKTDLFHC